MGWTTILGLVLQYLPGIVNAILSLPGLIGGAEATGAPGPDKKAAVVSGAMALLDTGAAFANPGTVVGKLASPELQNQVAAGIGAITDLTVGLLNAAGVFQKSIPSAPEKFGA